MTVGDWLRLALAGGLTFLLSGIIVGAYAALLGRTELPERTPLGASVLWAIGAIGAAVVFGILAFQAVMGVGRWLGL